MWSMCRVLVQIAILSQCLLRSGVKMVTGELSRMPDEILDTSITSIAGGEPLGSSTDFTLTLHL